MNIKILIVDDKKEYLQTAMQYIIEDDVPYALLCAPDGEKGIEIAKKEMPDVIIMDWEMPGMGGIKATKCLKEDEITKDIPVIIATGIRISPEDLKTAFEAGASDFIRKPLEKTEFLARISSHLKQAEYLAKIKLQSDIISEAENKKLNEIIALLKSANEENYEIISFYDNMFSVFLKRIEDMTENSKLKNEDLQDFASAINLSRKKAFNALNNRNIPDSDYVKALLRKHSNLTSSEIQLSFFIKNNLQSKEIAELTFREPGSIKVFRSRLRKKLGLDETTNLYTYLNSI